MQSDASGNYIQLSFVYCIRFVVVRSPWVTDHHLSDLERLLKLFRECSTWRL